VATRHTKDIMKINFKMGFFRLWVGASIVWIAAAGSLLFPEVNNQVSILPDSLIFDEAYKLAIRLRTGDISERQKELYEELVRRKVWPKFTFSRDAQDENVMSKPLEEQLQESAINVEYLDKAKEFPAGSEPSAIWDAYRPDIRNKKLQIYSKLAGWAFIPPLAALLVGLFIAWVFRGFVALDENT